MKINEINIDGFGKLKNFHIEFKNGFNIIYGNNEDGKSTLMSFINMMFYGSPPPVARNDVLINPREKYIPKDGRKMGGNIIFENEGKLYRLEREFGESNADDIITLTNLTEGIHMELPEKTSIGQMFFGFTAAAFEKTFFISQIGSIADDDEINQRLANLNSTGDESVSAVKVRERLISAKESFKSKNGTSGKLDRRYIKLHEFEELMKKEEQDEVEKALMLGKATELSDKIEYYEQTYKLTNEKISIQEKLSRLERLKATAAYQSKFDELTKQLNEKHSHLVNGNFTVDSQFIKQCDDGLDCLKELEIKRLNNESEFTRIQNSLKNHTEDVIIEEANKSINDIQNKIMHYSLEIKNTDDEIAKVRSTIMTVEDKLKASEIDFHLSENNFKSVQSIYKQKIQLAEQQLHTASTPKALEQPKDKGVNINPKYLISSILILFAAIILAFMVHPVCIFISGISVATAIKALNLKDGKSKNKPFEYVNHVEIAKYTDNLQKVRNAAEEEKINAQMNMQNAKNRISDFRNEISKLRYKIPELETRKKDIESAITELQKQKNSYEIKIAESKSSINAQKAQLDYISSLITSIENDQNNVMRQLLNHFRKYKYVNDIDSFYMELSDIKSIVDDINKIHIQMDSLRQSAPMQHGSFSITQVYEQIESIESALMKKNNGVLPEKIDEQEIEKIKSQSSILLNGINKCKEDYTNINAVMRTKFKDSIGISHIEHEINIIKNEIEDNEQYCSNIELAIQFLDEAAEDMKRNFGSGLNLKTASILEKITGGKYNGVQVSSDFNISVRNDDSSTTEWHSLSSGTVDQAYFSLRFAVADMLSDNNNSMPIMIDDAFIQYDDIRTKQGLDFLDEQSKNSQIIFFTCHSHLIDMAVNQKLNVKVTHMTNK